MSSRRRRWTRKELIALLRAEAQRIGRTPRDRDLRSPERLCPALRTYALAFGSLGVAQAAAGLVFNNRGNIPGTRKAVCRRGHHRTPENVDAQGHCRACAAFWKVREGRGYMAPKPGRSGPKPRAELLRFLRTRKPPTLVDAIRREMELEKHWRITARRTA